MPNLIEVQKASYDQFLLVEEPQGGRPDEGLQAVFKSVFPIKDFSNTAHARIRPLRVRAAEVRRRRVPPARHDLCRAAEGDAAPHRVRYRRGDRRTLGQGHQGAGRLHGRHAAHDRRTAPSSSTAPSASSSRRCTARPGVFFDHDKGKTHSSGKLLFAARIIPYRGSWLDIEFDAKDIVYARIDRRRKMPVTSLLYALGMDGEEILDTFYKHDRLQARPRTAGACRSTPNRMRGVKADHDLIDADTGEVVVEAGKKITVRQARQLAEKGLKALRVTDEDLDRPLHRRGPGQPEDRRDLRRGRRRAHREAAQGARRGRLQRAAGARHRPRQCRRLHPQHAGGRQEHDARGRAVRHLPRHASGRAADGRNRRGDVQVAVLRFRALRPLGGRPREDEHAPRPRRAEDTVRMLRKEDILGGGQDAGRPARRPGRDRRHRPSRQPPGALGRRTDGEPVPHRPAAHGARDQGAHVLGRYRHGHAAGPDQRQAGGRRGARVLRLLAALAVHGPDQPAVGDHPQAPPLGAWPGRSDPRARRLRSARRAPDPLRPHLPDRDAGRPEHRPDQLARHLSRGSTSTASSRARTAGSRTASVTDEVVYLSAMEEGRYSVAQANAPIDARRPLHRRPDRLPPCRRRAAGPARPASTSWTCRRSSSSRSPRR